MSNVNATLFVIHLQDIFHFQNGSTIFLGRLVKGKRMFFPSMAKIMVDGEECGKVVLRNRMLPSPNLLPTDVVSVQCNEVVNLDRQFVIEHQCELVVEVETV